MSKLLNPYARHSLKYCISFDFFYFSLHYEEDWSGDHSAVLDGDQGNVVLYWSIQEEYIYFKVGTFNNYWLKSLDTDIFFNILNKYPKFASLKIRELVLMIFFMALLTAWLMDRQS